MAWEILGQYELQERVGRGGAATVWKARHLLLESVHAVKVLTAESEELAQRMLREGRVQARLRHPSIVPVTDLIRADHKIALVMPFIEGGTLEERLRHGPLPPTEALEIFRQLVDGLHHAHEAGVLHRDLKPANVMMDKGVARITDFGLAGLMDAPKEGERLTRVGIALGTPGYMAPELWLNPADADARADIFSLAAVLYDMMVGHAPFVGEGPRQVFDATMTGSFVDLREAAPACPPHVAEVVAACLSAEPRKRPWSCRALAGRLGWDLDERSLPPMDDETPGAAPTPAPRAVPGLPPLPMGSSVGGLSIVAPYAELMEDEPTELADHKPLPKPASPTLEPLPTPHPRVVASTREPEPDEVPTERPRLTPSIAPASSPPPPNPSLRSIAPAPSTPPSLPPASASPPSLPPTPSASQSLPPASSAPPSLPPSSSTPLSRPPQSLPPTRTPPSQPLAPRAELPRMRAASLPTWSSANEESFEAPERPPRPAPEPTPLPEPDEPLAQGWIIAGLIGMALAVTLLVFGLQHRTLLIEQGRIEREAARAEAARPKPAPPAPVCAGASDQRLGWLYVEAEQKPEEGAEMELISPAELRAAPPIEGVRAAVACQLPAGQRIRLSVGAVEEGEGRYWVPLAGRDLLEAE